MTTVAPEPGSFRDHRGRVFYVDDRVLRTVMPVAIDDFEFVRSSGLVDDLIADGLLVEESRADEALLGRAGADAALILEHPRIPFVSYPYEWSFAALKAAALLHLELHQRALRKNVTLTDASAYNIQFLGARPLFIDSLSLRKYVDGEFWAGHRQFCEQFINPLLLRSVVGLSHNAWFRGALEGISADELSRVLPWHSRLSWNILTHVFMQSRLQSSSSHSEAAVERARSRKLKKIGFEEILYGLHRWISRLQPKSRDATVWQDYALDNSYVDDEVARKRAFIADFVSGVTPGLLFDIGCNTGDYSVLALESGAGYVVGFDFDTGALDHAFRRAQRDNLNFLSLHMDAANPSPSQGWMQHERRGFGERVQGDAIIALAVVHHLAISKNLPLDQVVDWIISMAPQGVIEFVPKSDPMVQRLLSLREDIFADYDEESFRSIVGTRARIIKSSDVSSGGRTLYWYERS